MSQLDPPASGPRARIFALIAAVTFAVMVTSAGPARVTAEDGGERPGSIVATTEVLGAIVGPLVGDAAEVVVLMDGGTNPHTFEPSARDAERILSADVLVSNGLDLEEGLLDVLESARAEGVTWFEAADHVATRGLEPDGEADQDGHEHAAEDPHIWTDPLAMRDVAAALGPVLVDVGIDVTAETADLVAELEALDAEVSHILSVLAAEDRKLVTGHRSMGYFADRYGFEQLGTVIPSLSTNGEPTARELAQLIADIKDSEVTAVFAEIGTPQAVAEAVAGDSGAELVTLSTAQLPEDGTYASLIRDMATTVADALDA
jgi:zinc/manganese transport system substrate-binding protein